MAATTYDLVVVGAGMTGAGVALDAAARGLRVGHEFEVLQDGPRRPALSPAARVPTGLREPARTSAAPRERAVPRATTPLPRSPLRSQRRGVQGAREGLLDGAADLRPERGVANRSPPPPDHSRPGARVSADTQH